jgi:hypothetical protein
MRKYVILNVIGMILVLPFIVLLFVGMYKAIIVNPAAVIAVGITIGGIAGFIILLKNNSRSR